MNLFYSNKGQARNYFAVITIIMIFGFLSIFSYLLVHNFVIEFDNAGYDDSPVHTVGISFLKGISWFDNIMVLIMILLIIGIGVTSYRLAAPPIFFLINFIMAAVYGFISYFFNYLFQELVSDAIFTATLLYFPNTILICTNLHWIMLICIIVGSITLFAKKEKGQYLS